VASALRRIAAALRRIAAALRRVASARRAAEAAAALGHERLGGVVGLRRGEHEDAEVGEDVHSAVEELEHGRRAAAILVNHAGKEKQEELQRYPHEKG